MRNLVKTASILFVLALLVTSILTVQMFASAGTEILFGEDSSPNASDASVEESEGPALRNLFKNGDFSDGLTGWTESDETTIVNGAAHVTRRGFLAQTVKVDPSRLYTISGQIFMVDPKYSENSFMYLRADALNAEGKQISMIDMGTIVEYKKSTEAYARLDENNYFSKTLGNGGFRELPAGTVAVRIHFDNDAAWSTWSYDNMCLTDGVTTVDMEVSEDESVDEPEYIETVLYEETAEELQIRQEEDFRIAIPMGKAPKVLKEGEYYELTINGYWVPGFGGWGADICLYYSEEETITPNAYFDYTYQITRSWKFTDAGNCPKDADLTLVLSENAKDYGAESGGKLKYTEIKLVLYSFPEDPSEESAESSVEDSDSSADESDASADESETSLEILAGDAISDGVLDMKDVLAIRKAIAKMDVTIDELAADFNGDGNLDMKDVLGLRKLIAHIA